MPQKKSDTKQPTLRPAKREDGLQPRYGQLADMLRGSKGITVAEIQEAFGVQAHTARAMLSVLRKKHGLAIEMERQPGGALYRIPGSGGRGASSTAEVNPSA